MVETQKNLSHVSPENFLGATLGENEFQSIFKTNFGWLASTEDQIAGHLKAPHCHNYYHIPSMNLSEVWSTLIGWQLGIKSVYVLKMIILQYADFHGIVLLSSFGIFLHLLLEFFTFDPLTS